MKNVLQTRMVHAIAFFAILSLIVVLVGCPAFEGLKPAGSGTIVTFTVPASHSGIASGRALFSSGMTLYLRTIGGSASAGGSLYGPYTLEGNTFTTTDIPAGSYAKLLVIAFSAAPAPEVLSILALPDSDLTTALSDNITNASFDSLCDGFACAGQSGPLTLVEGTNRLALTLLPLCGPNSTLTMTAEGSSLYGSILLSTDTGAAYRRFLKLDLSSFTGNATLMDLACDVFSGTPALTVYDAQGVLLGRPVLDSTSGFLVLNCLSLQSHLYILVETAAVSEELTFYCTPQTPRIAVTGPTDFYSTPGTLTSGASVSFGMIMSSEDPLTHTITFTVANAGLADLTIDSCTFDPATWAAYWTSHFPTAPVTIPPGESRDYTIDFIYNYDSTYKTKTATMTIASDDPEQPTFVLNLSGSTS